MKYLPAIGSGDGSGQDGSGDQSEHLEFGYASGQGKANNLTHLFMITLCHIIQIEATSIGSFQALHIFLGLDDDLNASKWFGVDCKTLKRDNACDRERKGYIRVKDTCPVSCP